MREGAMGPIARLDFLQAIIRCARFAKETGGSPSSALLREFPSIYRGIHEALRNQYSSATARRTPPKDGKYRQDQGGTGDPANNEPLAHHRRKGKPVKYSIVAKAGYTAPREVE